MYRCEASSVEGFVQQVAVSYLLHGYFYFVTGRIPDRKKAGTVDEKLINQYGLGISKWTRCRRLKKGIASVQYLRHRQFFVLAATEGEHRFFEEERKVVRDIREKPLSCFGYEIGCYQRNGKWHPSVRIGRREFLRLRKEFRGLALQKSRQELAQCVRSLPFAPFAPVRRQCFNLLRLVNLRRKEAGLPVVSGHCVRQRRKPVRVFQGSGGGPGDFVAD